MRPAFHVKGGDNITEKEKELIEKLKELKAEKQRHDKQIKLLKAAAIGLMIYIIVSFGLLVAGIFYDPLWIALDLLCFIANAATIMLLLYFVPKKEAPVHVKAIFYFALCLNAGMFLQFLIENI